MKIRKENKEKRGKRIIFNFLISLFSLFSFLFSTNLQAQDSIPEKADLTEEAELKFQQFFFKALSQKSIGNHKKAIENLENCNQILPENKTVFFEFSKNYLALKKIYLAKEYINRALVKDANNIWMLKHLVSVYVNDSDFKNAIETQKKVIALNPKERVYLVRLYLYNRDYKNAVDLLNTLEKDNMLTANLRKLKMSLEARKNLSKKFENVTDIATLMQRFDKEKSYETLKKILELSKNNVNVLLKYSDIGVNLYPEQAFVYLSKGKALIAKEKYNEALDVLKNGIDFVIEDDMEADFFLTMAKAYKGLGEINQEINYKAKAKKLKS